MKYFPMIFLVYLIIICPFHLLSESKTDGTVVSVLGIVKAKEKLTSNWIVLKIGDEIPLGIQIKTGQGSSIRILNSNASMTRIGENRTVTYQQVNIAAPSKNDNRLDDFLTELFDEKDRRRIAAVRAQDARQEQWVEMMLKKRYSADDLPLLFELMLFYKDINRNNRSHALLIRLINQFPKSAGLRALNNQEESGKHQMLKWQALQVENEKKTIIYQNRNLTYGDRIQVRYSAEQESYYYLFMTSQSSKNQLDTVKIFPDKPVGKKNKKDKYQFTSRVKAKRDLFLPSEQKAFVLDNFIGIEHFWGWSCCGPVISKKQIDQIIHQVENSLLEKKAFSKHSITDLAPAVCMHGFYLRFNHI